MVVVIVREDLIRDDLDPRPPIYLQYKTHADAGSMYNTPNCWAIYCCGKVFKYLLKSIGGLEEMEKRNSKRPRCFMTSWIPPSSSRAPCEPEDRSPHERPVRHRRLPIWTRKSSPLPRRPASTTSRATSPSAACAPPSTTPCPRKAWRPWWSSSRSSRLSIRRNVCLSGRRSGKPDKSPHSDNKTYHQGEYYYAYSYYRRYGQGRHGAAA